MLKKLHKELLSLRDPKKADFMANYFKTGKGEYAEGDVFLGGIVTDVARKISGKYRDLPMSDVEKLLKSKYHEERWIALGIFANRYKLADSETKKQLYDFYLKNTKYINNWDLVDGSAGPIVGTYILDNPKEVTVLDKLVKSKNLWERRISIMATFAFIKKGNFDKTLEIAEKLLTDKEDLIHKAVGWMLREVGNRDLATEEKFLKKNIKAMPRTMLRYAIEKFPEKLRLQYLRQI
jgi:3-methyladenine DNA glycosylase AlkD